MTTSQLQNFCNFVFVLLCADCLLFSDIQTCTDTNSHVRARGFSKMQRNASKIVKLTNKMKKNWCGFGAFEGWKSVKKTRMFGKMFGNNT